MDKLLEVKANLLTWQKQERAAGRSRASRCLEAVRHACAEEGLRLPPPMPRPRNTALANWEALGAAPEAFGWRRIHSPLTEPCLVYFKRCGILPDKRVAGHVALYVPADGKLYANLTYNWNQYWADRLVGAFTVL